MFTTSESKGIVRATPQEFQLSADYNEKDKLSAEFIRTCKHDDFHGAQFLQLAALVLDGKPILENVALPQHRLAKQQVPWSMCYACRPKDASC
eukprot:7553194-Karenia_brevis.AAC.1